MNRETPGATRWILTCPDCGRSWELIGRGRWRRRGLHHLPSAASHPRFANVPAVRDQVLSVAMNLDQLDGPKLADPASPITRTVKKRLQCYDCHHHAEALEAAASLGVDASSVDDLMAAMGPLSQWSYMRRVIEAGRALPADPNGMKTCLYCGEKYPVGRRSDSCYCPNRPCAQNVKRRMDRLRTGRPLTPAMNAHTPAAFRYFLDNTRREGSFILPMT